ncbi:MAG: Inner membrane protein YbaL [Microgenomates bacterium OLB22]|nr:MAG: Inner membrane protein YbaL [Microgenomates bacterium OLB22]
MIVVLTKMKYNSRTVFSVGLFLSQVGEFAFILLREGHMKGLISADAMAFGTGVSLMTLLISPYLIQHHLFLYRHVRSIIKNHVPLLEEFIAYRIDREGSASRGIATAHTDHVILCGYGRVGSYVGRALTLSNVPFCAIDYNQHIVQKERQAGTDIIYGDPTSVDILDMAGVKEAKALIIALPDNFSQELVLLSARKKNPKIMIFARVRQKDEQLRLKSLGADVVIQPEFEAALSLVKKIMLAKHMNAEDIQGKIKRLKIEHGMA